MSTYIEGIIKHKDMNTIIIASLIVSAIALVLGVIVEIDRSSFDRVTVYDMVTGLILIACPIVNIAIIMIALEDMKRIINKNR
jgi:heme/copper-type cytochrome/quinol oxidase subunit 4